LTEVNPGWQKHMNGITASQAAYLGELFRLGGESDFVNPGAWADTLGVSPAAVSRMSRRLERAGLIQRKPYSGVRLTPRGREEGVKAVRAHRIAEAYLVRVLEYGWHEAHDTADRLGEIADEMLVSRMEKQAGYPRRCPHGEPIPRTDGSIEIPNDSPLSSFEEGQHGRISRVKVRDSDRLQYLAARGLLPEAPFTVAGKAPFDGPMRLALPTGECVLGMELARAIWVEAAPAPSQGNRLVDSS
jgi:DtxR family Mn-dependent transcriptional regulator